MKVVAILLAGLLALGGAAGGAVWWQHRELVRFAAAAQAVAADTVVEIPAGTGPRVVADRLLAAGVISDARLFYWNLRFLRRAAGRLRSGEYLFRAGVPQTPDQIIDRLLRGEVLSVKVTVPEGLRADEQARLFADAGLAEAEEYVRLSRDAAFARGLGVPADSLEGYLFPSTYLIPRRMPVADILRLQVEHFRAAYAEADRQRAPDVTLNLHEAATLASIVEKETGRADERGRISCVFHNRLRQGIRLQTDPTVIYSVLLQTGAFDGNLRRVHLETPHPYNTYTTKGLPPGPIASAGQAALAAALNPERCNDLFFVSRNDGSHVFCPDLACHEANVEKWQREYFRQKRRQKQ